MPGFPLYARGVFDMTVGHDAPPAFRLTSEGRSVAYRYLGPETRVRVNNDYRIQAFLKPDQLETSRACLCAFFVTHTGQPIMDTLVRSIYVGSNKQNDDWTPVELYLPSAPSDAYTIGLAVWVLQESQWSHAQRRRRHIPMTDVRGGVWVDDVSIGSIPRVALATSSPGNVLVEGEPSTLLATLSDRMYGRLTGQLTIVGAEGNLVQQQTINVRSDAQSAPTEVSLDHLQPGIYHAELNVFDHDEWVMSRKLTFVRATAARTRIKTRGRTFGVVISPSHRKDFPTEFSLVSQLAVRSVKIPVWTGLAELSPMSVHSRDLDRHLQLLVKHGFALTGVFVGPPAEIVRHDGPYQRSLVDLLADDPASWESHLAMAVAPSASFFDRWQVGGNSSDIVVDREKFLLAIGHLREAMKAYIAIPQIELPVFPSFELNKQAWGSEQASLRIGPETEQTTFQSLIQETRQLGYQRVAVYIEASSGDKYQRLPRLADYAQRVIQARFADAATVFVPQPWHMRDTIRGAVIEPTEEYLVIRTIADILADAMPSGRIPTPDGQQVLAFRGASGMTLAMWDPHAKPGGSTLSIQLGQASEQIDIWGQSTPLTRDTKGRHVVTLTPMPVFIPHVDPVLISFRSTIVWEPASVESGTELVNHTLTLSNQTDQVMSGEVFLVGHDNWKIIPRSANFSLLPQRKRVLPFRVKYPHNEPAGLRRLIAQVRMTDGVYMEVPLQIEVGLEGIEISGVAVVEGGDLLLRHVVTNRTQDELHFRGSAVVAGRERQYRPLPNIQPGDTQIVTYRFRNGTSLINTTLRLELRELNDGPRTHVLELRVP